MALPNRAQEVKADLYKLTIPLLGALSEIHTRMFMAALIILAQKRGK